MRTDKNLTWEDFKKGAAYGLGFIKPLKETKKRIKNRNFELLLQFEHFELYKSEFDIIDLTNHWHFTEQVESIVVIDTKNYFIKME